MRTLNVEKTSHSLGVVGFFLSKKWWAGWEPSTFKETIVMDSNTLLAIAGILVSIFSKEIRDFFNLK
ncbi:hypothetical protein BKH42_06840 [Helicobacter sp. 13S00482-2]|uniref:hypothetical protein n=1 Tax=Helicobacter sp. 13S00482-2 TaxID=1476200 RepID=UPI000BA54547|nr:hypothetical protein [Helicobacter sp. 13S00482-2]PAF53238.1 hypothetical protein BKH42_06840 [Helicobacter sp. 13S00482-2]